MATKGHCIDLDPPSPTAPARRKTTAKKRKHASFERTFGEREAGTQTRQRRIHALEVELEHLEETNQALLLKEREATTHIIEAKRALINGWKYMDDKPSAIGVKTLGELNPRPFRVACNRKYSSDEEAEKKAAELITLWQSYLGDPNWHPFKVVDDQEIVDKKDEKLKTLKYEYGPEVRDAVCIALAELNECNGSGRYVVKELWNLKENRKASLGEAVTALLKICRNASAL